MEEVILVEIILGLDLAQPLSSSEAPCGFLDQLIVRLGIYRWEFEYLIEQIRSYLVVFDCILELIDWAW